MITLTAAKQIVLDNLAEGTKITSAIEYGDEYMFIAIGPNQLEGRFDPFIKVNKKTGLCIDFSPQDYDKPREIIDALKEAANDT